MRPSVLQSIKNNLEKPLVGILIYYLFAVLMVWDNNMSVLTDDAISFLCSYERFGFSEFGTSYGFTSLYYAHDFMTIVLYKILGKNPLAWFYVLLFIHSTSAYYFYRFATETLKETRRENTYIIALLASVLMLFSASIEEIIYWPAVLHYLFSMLFLSISLYYISSHKAQLSYTQQGVIWILFALFTTMMEIVFFFPLAYLGVWIFYRGYRVLLSSPLQLLQFVSPYFIIGLLYLIINYQINGSFVPHYGSDHLDIRFYDSLYTLYQYLVKHVFFGHSFGYGVREKLYDVAPQTMYIFFAMVLVALLALLYFWRHRLRHTKDYVLYLWLSLVFYLPVSSLFFTWVATFENSRYGYFFMCFVFLFLALFLVHNFKKTGKALLVLLVLTNLVLFKKNTQRVKHAVILSEKIMADSYKPYLNTKPYILNLPQSYDGIFMLRDSSRFQNYAQYHYGQNIEYTLVASMPFFTPHDSVTYHIADDSTLTMQVAAPGSWFMIGSLGAQDYTTAELSVSFTPWGEATVRFHNRDTTRPILYVSSSRGFTEVNQNTGK